MDFRDLILIFIDDLKNFWNARWENKALIVVGVVVLLILIYAFNPFQAKSNVTVGNDSPVPQTSTGPTPRTTQDSLNTSNSTNTTGNNTFLITAEDAKRIALDGNPGYTAGNPLQGNIVVNQTTIVVWIVPISKQSQSKNVYVDVNSGNVIDV